MKVEGMTQSLEEGGGGRGGISPQLRLVLNLQHITQLVMFYSFCRVPETVERASEMNRHQMGALPAKDSVVPPARLCGHRWWR